MDEELKNLLTILIVAIPIGLVLGLVLRKGFPAICKRWTRYCLDARWKLFALGVLLFSVLAAGSFLMGRVYFGWFFTAFAGLELWAFFAYGFKPLSEDMEERIDQWDPTKLFPFRFWK